MHIILSQKIDTRSDYSGDQIFKVYHYPAKYKNQIHTGDVFVYYQGNRYVKAQRYYFGTGVIGTIRQEDEDNYYAELINVIRFDRRIPIYLPQGGYIEQLGYETIRKSVNPPWQTSIRPLSIEAYEYIIKNSGENALIEIYNAKLKNSVDDYYASHDKKAILRILEYSKKIAEIYRF